MYEGSNPVAVQSGEWLIEALFALLKENDYSKITVRDICRKADLSRQTFYNFFDTKEDIIRCCLRGRLEPFLQMLRTREALSLQDIIRVFDSFQRQNASLLELLQNGSPADILADEIQAFLDELLPSAYALSGRTGNKYEYDFLSGALTRVIVCWFHDTDRVPPAELSKELANLINGRAFRSCVKNK